MGLRLRLTVGAITVVAVERVAVSTWWLARLRERDPFQRMVAAERLALGMVLVVVEVGESR